MPRSLRAIPGVSDGNVTVSFSLGRSAAANCVVHDAAGNVVTRLASGVLGAGEHRLSLAGARLRPGIYFCTLASGRTSETTRLTVVR